MADLNDIFKAYDIRGTVPDQLDADVAGRIGAAFARFAKADGILVARDCAGRSSPRPLKVVADTANGMGGLVVPRVFEGLPFDLEILYPELDGSFPNHPADPIQPDNLKDLQARVLDTRADVGLAFDGDADRVFLVDERAQPVSGSLTTAMVAQAMLEKHPGSVIIHNL